MKKPKPAAKTDLPPAARNFATRHAQIWAAYETLGAAAAKAGPLDARTRRLVKLALAIGAQAQGAASSHARRAREEGASTADMYHVAALAVTTLGLPAAVRAMAWIDGAIEQKPAKRKT
ncbi:carboxymuconolactone decarboxylase family protein [Ferrovibrio sp.]|uniref:carboxymuconolactone decarboxylase family protein n=1 Tax=Ferrovibrio sp. TaxID=1917215 RepID=UPI0035AF7FA2